MTVPTNDVGFSSYQINEDMTFKKVKDFTPPILITVHGRIPDRFVFTNAERNITNL